MSFEGGVMEWLCACVVVEVTCGARLFIQNAKKYVYTRGNFSNFSVIFFWAKQTFLHQERLLSIARKSIYKESKRRFLDARYFC